MSWYKYKMINRARGIMENGEVKIVYQNGIQLINEKGETKDIWEKKK